MAKMRRISIALALALGFALLATSASATPPRRTHYSYDGPGGTTTDLCDFEITITILVGEDDFTEYFDRDGNLIMALDHFTQQDAFSANGKTLTGVPYTANLQTYVHDGIMTAVADGVLEKVPLPDGSLFIAAGRVNPFAGFAITPGQGAIVNLAGFCEALAP